MGSNLETVRANYDHFNNRAYDKLVEPVAESCVFIDAQGEKYRGKAGLRAYAEGWITAFSNGKATDIKLYDAGDTVIAEFVGRGKNDGPLGPMPATGKTAQLPYLEIFHFDATGQIVGGHAYTNMLALMTQLGAAPSVPQQVDVTKAEKAKAKARS